MRMSVNGRRFGLVLAVMAGAAAAGCDDDDDEHKADLGTPAPADLGRVADLGATPTDGAAGAGDAGAADAGVGDGGAAAGALTDSQILGVVFVANQGEIQEGQLAVTKASKADVRAFGQQMVTEHTASNNAVQALATQLGLTVNTNSALANRLRQETALMMDELTAKPAGLAFDQAYITGQISMHNELIGIIDSDLKPQAKAAELQAFLANYRITVVNHLQEAAGLQSGLDP